MTAPTNPPFAYDVFLSYSHANNAWVRGELLPQLDAAGLKTFIDFRDFDLGAPSITEMERGVLTSRQTLLVLTPAYIASDWTTFEALMLQTLDPVNRARRLIPLLKERCELPPRIGMLNYVDFTDPATYDAVWPRLLHALAAPDPTAPPPAAPAPPAAPSPTTIAKLCNALANLYADQPSIRRVAGDAGLAIQMIDWGGSTLNNWHAVLAEAQKQQRLDALLAVAQSEYATNADLRNAIAEVPR
ncbi:MAG: TIR domain-containing protein [Caldilineaceae bacterium]